MRKQGKIVAGVACATGVLLATSALAGGFAIREQSTTGLGSAFAGSAAGGDLSSMYWNPAAVTTQDGLNSASAYTLIIPDTAVDVTASTFGAAADSDLGTLGILGSSYYNYQLSNDLYVGLSVNAPFGLTTKADNRNWGGETYNRKSEILTLNAAPTIGYKIMPNLSVAAGVQVEYIKVRLASANPVVLANDIVIKGDDIAAGFTLGALFEPVSGTKIGAGYRSAIHHVIEGKVFGHPAVALNGNASAKLDTPDMVTVSLSQQLTEGFTLMANYEWSNWSNLSQLRVVNDANGAVIAEDYRWKDSWFASLGAELKLSDSLVGRTGVGYEKSPVPDTTRSARLPDSDRVWLSVGATYNWSSATQVDFGYSHIFFDDSTINQAVAGKGLLKGDVTNSADIISAGLRVKW